MDPYRLFFPLGAIYAMAGTALWIAAALGGTPYPAELHRVLMIQGFEHCFVTGFLLTALPGLTHSEKARPAEIAAALAPLALFGVLALAERRIEAQILWLVSLAVLALAALRRLPRATQPPPVEFLFVLLGLAFGAAGSILLALPSAAQALALPARFADHLLSLGMVLTLVLGVGGLLVPTFTGMRDPLEIPFIARAHQRGPRLALYAVVAAGLAGAFVLEAAGRSAAGALVRALAGTAMLLLVWKLPRGPGRRDLSALAMWSAGVLTLAGLWLLVFVPARPMAGLHVLFIGGFGLLTFAIGTRVVVAHGRHGLAAEIRVLGPLTVAGVAGALVLRLGAETFGALAMPLYGWAAAAWVFAWLAWLAGAGPRITRVQPPPAGGPTVSPR